MLSRTSRSLVIDDPAAIVFGLDLVVAGRHHDQVHAGGTHLLLDGGLRPAAESDHGENRRDANGHAEHRQDCLQLVATERLQGDR